MLISQAKDSVLPAGQWTELRYGCGEVARDHIQLLRVYYHRGDLGTGAFDIDEMILHPIVEQARTGETGEKPVDHEGEAVPD